VRTWLDAPWRRVETGRYSKPKRAKARSPNRPRFVARARRANLKSALHWAGAAPLPVSRYPVECSTRGNQSAALWVWNTLLRALQPATCRMTPFLV
jgi:hypothetical protein